MFVPQDDIVHSDLTVFQNLYYNAMLRLPKQVDVAAKLAHVQDCINVLVSTARLVSRAQPPHTCVWWPAGGEGVRVRSESSQTAGTSPFFVFASSIQGLAHIQNDLVGSPEKRGVSGGQKKRVNIGMELVASCGSCGRGGGGTAPWRAFESKQHVMMTMSMHTTATCFVSK